jgi:hypothetical protein
MATAFDFHTLSLSIDQTLAEYQQALEQSKAAGLGMNVWEVATGDRSQTLRFRHEHAHFSSFMASGLADLYGIFGDYALVFLHAVMDRLVYQPNLPANVPLLLTPVNESQMQTAARDLIARAWKQFNTIRAIFFGFGGKHTVADLLNPETQEVFWKEFGNPRLYPIIGRFGQLMSQLLPAEDINKRDLTKASALPPVKLNGTLHELTTRSVMEAYAITIEILNTYFRGVHTDLTFYSESPSRNPGSFYTIAIEYALHHAIQPQTTLQEFLSGSAPIEVYYLMAALSFAAMQVPVIQELDGNVSIAGNLNTLIPAWRFWMIVDARVKRLIPDLPQNVRSAASAHEFLGWLRKCSEAIGDPISATHATRAKEAVENDPRLSNMSPESQSLIDLSWAARANLETFPNEYVLDAGLFAQRYPCQPRFIRTLDSKLVIIGETPAFQSRYVAEQAVPILEAAIFPEHWDATWEKMPEISEEERADLIKGVAGYCAFLFNDAKAGQDPSLPTVTPQL